MTSSLPMNSILVSVVSWFKKQFVVVEKRFLLSQLHFKDGFFPSDLPKRKRTAGLRLKEDFSKKRISRL